LRRSKGCRRKREVNHLINFGAKFIQSGRLVVPSSATQLLVGRVCQKLRSSGRLDPANPRIYNDLARQIGAVVVTTNISDFKKIHQVVDFKFRKVI
jgi:predicted nucleic acid-binding protein